MDAEKRPGVVTRFGGAAGASTTIDETGSPGLSAVHPPTAADLPAESERHTGEPPKGGLRSDPGAATDRVEFDSPSIRESSHPDLRIGYVFALGLGALFAALGVYLAARTLPRFADVQARYHFSLPAETRWILRSGWLQPVPGCFLILAGLTGLLARSPGRRHALATVVIVLLALALVAATGAALLLPELTMV